MDGCLRITGAACSQGSLHYDIWTKENFLPSGMLDEYDMQRDREILAAIDFIVCQQSGTFVGKSCSGDGGS